MACGLCGTSRSPCDILFYGEGGVMCIFHLGKAVKHLSIVLLSCIWWRPPNFPVNFCLLYRICTWSFHELSSVLWPRNRYWCVTSAFVGSVIPWCSCVQQPLWPVPLCPTAAVARDTVSNSCCGPCRCVHQLLWPVTLCPTAAVARAAVSNSCCGSCRCLLCHCNSSIPTNASSSYFVLCWCVFYWCVPSWRVFCWCFIYWWVLCRCFLCLSVLWFCVSINVSTTVLMFLMLICALALCPLLMCPLLFCPLLMWPLLLCPLQMCSMWIFISWWFLCWCILCCCVLCWCVHSWFVLCCSVIYWWILYANVSSADVSSDAASYTDVSCLMCPLPLYPMLICPLMTVVSSAYAYSADASSAYICRCVMLRENSLPMLLPLFLPMLSCFRSRR
jgi:hypothetical protein